MSKGLDYFYVHLMPKGAHQASGGIDLKMELARNVFRFYFFSAFRLVFLGLGPMFIGLCAGQGIGKTQRWRRGWSKEFRVAGRAVSRSLFRGEGPVWGVAGTLALWVVCLDPTSQKKMPELVGIGGHKRMRRGGGTERMIRLTFIFACGRGERDQDQPT